MFDLILAEIIGVAMAAVAVRLWATKELATGEADGAKFELAKIIKTVSA
jgi:hypothetical protein